MRSAFGVVIAVVWIVAGCDKAKAPPSGAGSPEPTAADAMATPADAAAPAEKLEPIDATAALAKITIAGDACQGKACARTGMTFMKTEPAKAIGYFRKGCETGDGISCGMVALAFKEGLGVEKSLPAAVALNTRSCDLGYFKGCYNLGLMLYNGEGIAADESKGLAVLEKACAGDAYRACGSLADLYLTTDKAKATRLAKRGCDNNDPMSCEVLDRIK